MLNQVFGKILRELFDILIKKIMAIADWILKKIIMRAITFLHEWGIFEVLGYILCFEMIYEGSKLDFEE